MNPSSIRPEVPANGSVCTAVRITDPFVGDWCERSEVRCVTLELQLISGWIANQQCLVLDVGAAESNSTVDDERPCVQAMFDQIELVCINDHAEVAGIDTRLCSDFVDEMGDELVTEEVERECHLIAAADLASEGLVEPRCRFDVGRRDRQVKLGTAIWAWCGRLSDDA